MTDDQHSASRYSVGGSENEYMDEGKTVLKNKKGITDLQGLFVEEEKSLARAYESLLDEVRSDTPITSELIRYAHGVVFGDLYDWAGRWRTVTISKPGVTWPPPDYLDDAMQAFERETLVTYPAASLVSDEEFCNALGHIQGSSWRSTLSARAMRARSSWSQTFSPFRRADYHWHTTLRTKEEIGISKLPRRQC